jgi:2-polyprenyl-3-methyl-5-hydroxy-6-metoxy-1,4-benzoquinol methylase
MAHNDEQRRVDTLSDWYVSQQLDFDRQLIRMRARSIEPYFRGSRALELGPADGEMTRLLVERFHDLTAVDGSAELLAKLPAHPHLTTVHSLFEEFTPAQRFDTVIMEHILEHVDDPRALLRRASHWIADGGVLIAGVPNGHSIHRLAAVKMGLLGDPCELNERDHALGHRRVYTEETFHADLAGSGLKVVATGGVFFKALSNKQIETTFTPEMVRGFYELGKDFPQYAAELFAVCER